MENQPSAQPAHQAELVAWYLTFRVPLHFAAIPERMCQLCLLSLTESAEQRFGASYVPPEVDEGWRGRIISKSGIPLAGRKIKTLHWCPLGRAVARF